MTALPNHQTIPLNRLVVSDRNVRRADRKADIAALAASIASHGLLQNLAVADTGEGKFEVIAGGRRLAALKMLAKSGNLAKDFPVPCRVVPGGAGTETSLAENIHRVSMTALDEVEAFSALAAQSLTPDDIAHRFGVTRRHVDQRLALSNLSPKLKAAWKRGDLNLDAARAFCLVADHARQDAVFRSLTKPVTHPGSVRARLMEGRVKASDRLARFVGLKAYEAAGGQVLRDLFDAEAAYVENSSLLGQLAEAKLEAAKGEWSGLGWGWVDISVDGSRPDGLAAMRLQPGWRDPTVAEQAELDRLETEIAKLDAALEASSSDDDPRWSERDDLEAAFETIRQAAREWDHELIAFAGVMLSVSHDGACCATEGLVRKEDSKRIEAIRRQRALPGADTATRDTSAQQDEQSGDGSSHAGALPRAVVRDLTASRTQVIRQRIAEEPDIALALCVASLALRALRREDIPGVALLAQSVSVEDLEPLERQRGALETVVPLSGEDMLCWCLARDRQSLLAALAVLTAGAVDLRHEGATTRDGKRQAVADVLAQALDIDMAKFWRPDPVFWNRLPKTILAEALAQSPTVAGLAVKEAAAFLQASGKLKKDALADRVANAWLDCGYLPDLLVTPVAAGTLDLTEAGVSAIAAE